MLEQYRNIRSMFNDQTGHNIFGATMSINRFYFLVANMCFDDQETRPQRWDADRFAAFREIFEKFNTNCGKHVVPDDFLSLDETLYPMRTQIAFKQFNPIKPAKYGCCLNQSMPHVSPSLLSPVYAGKPVGVLVLSISLGLMLS